MGWIDRIADMLKLTDWGTKFSPAEIKAIAANLSIKRFDKEEVIIREGDRQTFLAFIVDGSVSIHKESDPSCVVERLERGTHFGELSLIDSHPRSASVVADDPTTLLILEQASFEELTNGNPHLGLKMVRSIAAQISARLRKTTEQFTHMEV